MVLAVSPPWRVAPAGLAELDSVQCVLDLPHLPGSATLINETITIECAYASKWRRRGILPHTVGVRVDLLCSQCGVVSCVQLVRCSQLCAVSGGGTSSSRAPTTCTSPSASSIVLSSAHGRSALSLVPAAYPQRVAGQWPAGRIWLSDPPWSSTDRRPSHSRSRRT